MTKPLIYMNNAATSWPKPPEVLEAVADCVRNPVFEAGRGSGIKSADYVAEAREDVSRFLGAEDSENIIFTSNATDSLNILISGFINARKGCVPHVLTTELDHNSVLRPLHEFERENKIGLGVVPFEKDNCRVSVDAVEAAVQKDTKLMVMTHASNVLGSVQNLKEIGDLLHEHGIFFIADGAQTAGHVNINLKSLPVDAFVFTGHKGLLGISGTGGFYLRDADKIEPTRFGGTGTNSVSLSQPREMPERFEAGTHNYPGLAALSAGIKFIEREGLKKLEAQTVSQTNFIIREFAKQDNITVHNKYPDVPVISFNISGVDNDDVGFILSKVYNIVSRTGLHCAPLVHKKIDGGVGSVRLSLSCFTTDGECETTANAVCEVAENAHTKVCSA
ncbi:MAG: aminotransferase class V-fold PLP-dependent enzyme [Methanocorpusculum sp.]|nr:aminotransferase class V-fold PLP-dependent enzyme [Methanocorpusculum sp.]